MGARVRALHRSRPHRGREQTKLQRETIAVMVVVYHYVRPIPSGLPYFRYLHVENFCRQLDYLQSRYAFPSRDVVLAALKGGPIPDNAVVLTFDDGLSDHCRFVLPELLKRGLWGAFYIPTSVLDAEWMLAVHRIHYLLGRFGGEHVREMLDAILEPRMLSKDGIARFHSVAYTRQPDDDAVKEVKRTLNYYVRDEW